MSVTFDPAKREANLAKHGIDLAECEAIFDWPVVTVEDEADYMEVRFRTLGLLRGAVVVLVWTERDEGPRVISCRKANSNEQKAYFENFPST